MKMSRSKKALSPVIASIILIAVTVAVSIAVAAWMGALSFSFMNNGEQMQLGSPYGWVNTGTLVNLRVSCPSGNAVYVSAVRIANVGATINGYTWDNGTYVAYSGSGNIGPIAAQRALILNLTTNAGAWSSGNSYTIVVTSAKNNEYQSTGTCP